MNKAITDGLALMPPPFTDGLDVWSREDGTPGSTTYEGAADAAIVTADQDFGGCIEIAKTETTQRLRYMGQTPILPGCYLRVRARIKAMSGDLPGVRVAAWAGAAGEEHLAGVPETGAETPLTTYGDVVEVAAIVGTGARGGVDMAWGREAIYGHFGLDLIGATGGVVRIDDIVIEDITSVFLRDLLDWVDVRDYGALGDGTTDDHAAFAAADAAAVASGRGLLVSKGMHYIGDTLTLDARVRFEGTVTMADAHRLQLTSDYDFPTYAAAFGDEELALRKALQALFHFTDHVTLDLKGRRVDLSAPLEVAALVPGIDAFAQRRGVANGQIGADPDGDWASVSLSRQATYDPSTAARQLSGISGAGDIPVGALVLGSGVGREVYVTSVNAAAGTVTLSQPLFDAEGTQNYTFTRFRYLFDFSGFGALDKFEMLGIEFLCRGEASCIMLAPEGLTFRISDCVINKPKDRGITSIGRGCQGMFVEQCQFLSNEMPLRAQDRSSIVLNVNANDTKIRNNRVVLFAHFAVMNGSGHMFIGNHFFHGDSEPNGVRQAGLVFTKTNVKSTVTGNYIDNSSIEWTNEHSAEPAFDNQFSFGGLTLTGNIFTVNGVASWFRWLIVKPYGPGHFIHGLNVSGNVFRTINGGIARVDGVDTTHAGLDYGRMRNIVVEGNAFNGIDQTIANPVTLRHDQNSTATTWTIDSAGFLPFEGRARNVDAFVLEGPAVNDGGATVNAMPYVSTEAGANGDKVQLHWPEAVKGRAHVTLRVDNPV
ncbi:hypothetical protein C2I36_12770 [Rhodobacteraceae bacterium WD3A24]|nr:hypothetical protein C2I36_12770 [Rhodobacteraceae bacterium WD3A24]